MKNKFLVPLILFVFLGIVLIVNVSKNNKVNTENITGNQDITLYYGDGCPHCELVDEYIEENDIESKFNITHKEVYNNRANGIELQATARQCDLDSDFVGVPFLYKDGLCLIGDKDIIDFFETSIKE